MSAQRDRSSAPIRQSAPAPRGAPLARGISESAQARFNYDFSNIRVHHTALAPLGARALTAGQQIVVDEREKDDPRLITHELAHVVQQRGGSGGLREKSAAALETEADAASRAYDRGAPIPSLSHAAPGAVQAKSRDEESSRVFSGMLGGGLAFGAVGTIAGALVGAAAGPLGAVLGGLLGGFVGSAIGVGLGALAGFLDDRRGGGEELDEERIKEVVAYLAVLKNDNNSKIQGGSGSDDLARDAVRLWKLDPAKFALDIDQRRILVMEMMDGRVSEDDEDGILDIVEGSSDGELLQIFVVKDSLAQSSTPAAMLQLSEVAAALGSSARERLEAMLAARFPTEAKDRPGALERRPIEDPFVRSELAKAYLSVNGIPGIEAGGVFLEMDDGTLRHEKGDEGAWSLNLRDTVGNALAKHGPNYRGVRCTYHTHPGERDTEGVARQAPSGTDVMAIGTYGADIAGHEHYVISPFTIYAITPDGKVEALGSTRGILGVEPSPELIKPKTALEYPR